MKSRICVTRQSIGALRMQISSSTPSRRSAAASNQMRSNPNYSSRRPVDRILLPLRPRPDKRPKQKSKHMVAFKEEFPYLRCDSGQLFEFDQAWLHAAITRAADQAGYPRWWLT